MSNITMNEATLSDEALGSLMMCLQKSLLEQSDIVPVLKNLRFTNVEGELFVLNPPVVKFEDEGHTDEEGD
tara:strand:- start:1519 stop:1731 length:213 start_codon:yes stop_codon:yes gene_type:complete